MRYHEAGVQLHCPPVLLNRLIILPREIQDMPHARVDGERKRVQFLSLLYLRQRLIEPPHCLQVISKEVMRRGIIRIEPDRLSELCLRSVPIPVVLEPDQSQRSMCLSQFRVKSEGATRCLFGFRVGLMRSHEVEECERRIAIRQARVSLSIVTVVLKRLFEEIN